MSNYTKGPWIAKGPDINAQDGTRIATCGITRNYADNAKLIAAAPELLDALLVVVADWTSQFECNGHLAPAWCKQARDAIAKAGV